MKRKMSTNTKLALVILFTVIISGFAYGAYLDLMEVTGRAQQRRLDAITQTD
jgi:hypothetical protein